MPRAKAMVPPEAIRIEDEVWQEAFARREPARPNRRRRLEAIEGGRASRLSDVAGTRPAASAVAPAVASAVTPAVDVPRSRLAVTPVPSTSSGSPPARRTVKIQGRGAERNLPVPDPARRRPTRRPHERAGFRPDRVAMWAVVLGFVLILVAISSGHG